MNLIKRFRSLCCIAFIASHVAANAVDIKELDKIEEFARQNGITDPKQIEQYKSQILSIIKTREQFTYMGIKDQCGADMSRLCPGISEHANLFQCLKDNRDAVTAECEGALKLQFGDKPIEHEEYYKGVLIPEGSKYTYDPRGNLIGIVVNEDVEHNGIWFKKGMIRFNANGISVATLVDDQYIDGVKYSATGIGPFFDLNGSVSNATLAEDALINSVLYKGNSQIQYHSKEQVKMGTLAQEVTIQGTTFKAGQIIYYSESGEVQRF